VSGKLHTPAALRPRKESKLTTEQEIGCAPAGHNGGGEKKIATPAGNRTPVVHP